MSQKKTVDYTSLGLKELDNISISILFSLKEFAHSVGQSNRSQPFMVLELLYLLDREVSLGIIILMCFILFLLNTFEFYCCSSTVFCLLPHSSPLPPQSPPPSLVSTPSLVLSMCPL